MRHRIRSVAVATTTIFSLISNVAAIQVDLTDPSSVKDAASTITHAMMQWYTGNLTGQVPGELPEPYFWWEGGALMGALMDYWYYTGDDTYNDIVQQGMLFQASPSHDFMPANQTKDEGNDDQVFWGFAAMTASEYKFPNPPADQPQWLALAQGVWNSQQLRWDKATCNGGLRWQIFTWNNGYDYKNAPSNAGFINLGARLYAYTGNETYAEWVTKAWDWMVGVNLISDHGQGPGFGVYDGTYVQTNCSSLASYIQWTYSPGMLLQAAAVMWNMTKDPTWEDRANGLWQASHIFFTQEKILWEVACEQPGGSCDTDELSFKGYFARFLAASTKWMPQLYEQFQPYFAASATAAAKSCTGTVAGLYGNACGFKWFQDGWDGTYGFGQQMDALQVIQANIIQQAPSPVTGSTGGITHGNPSAGTSGDATSIEPLSKITTASRAGASILTAVLIIGWLGGAWWLLV